MLVLGVVVGLVVVGSRHPDLGEVGVVLLAIVPLPELA